ncbi:MAG: hypothetical protein DMF61_26655 [Blastocatellia bacterium AA13]|nr:MAG: hypothetical protein DMF61_26655 [Blastocatellia bacterium AA13]
MKRISAADLISQQEAADLCGVTLQVIKQLVKRGRLKTVMIGKRAFLIRSEVEAFEASPGGRPKSKAVRRGIDERIAQSGWASEVEGQRRTSAAHKKKKRAEKGRAGSQKKRSR